MPSQTASISLGVTLGNTSKKGGAAIAQIFAGTIEQPQPYSGGTGIQQSAGSANQKLQLPTTMTIGKTMPDGTVQIDPNWWRFLHDLFEQRLGGSQGDSIPDITTTVVDTRAQAITAQSSVSAVAQQVDANAQALAATVQVAQNNSLTGSKQIPPVVYSPTHGQFER
jgi:hypothetical protein